MPLTPALTKHLKVKDLIPAAGFVGGQWRETAASGKTFEVHNPSTGELLAVLPDMGVAEAREAIAAAPGIACVTIQPANSERAMGMSVIPVFLVMGNLRLSEVIDYQAVHGWTAFPLLAPWHGQNLASYILWIPMLVSFLIFLVSAFAETNRLPFDLPESETELVGGYHTEYSAMKFALFFLGEYAAMIVASGLMVTLFFGGWSLPSATYMSWQSEWWSIPIYALVFLAKMCAFIVLFIWVRWTLPRFRYDQLMGLGWKCILPIALGNILLTGILLALIG